MIRFLPIDPVFGGFNKPAAELSVKREGSPAQCNFMPRAKRCGFMYLDTA